MKFFYRFLPVVAIYLMLTILLMGCNSSLKKPSGKQQVNDSSVVKYATGFDIYHHNKETRIVVYDPWQKGEILARFTLVNGQDSQGKLSVPLTKAAVFSATQLNALDRLGLLSHVMGISEAGYVKNEKIRNLLDKHQIIEMAAGGNYYVEKILSNPPQAIFYSPYQSNQHLPLALSSIVAIPYLDFMESTPLGRAEWIKFTAVFFGKEQQADSLFRVIEKSYLQLKRVTEKLPNRPTVFSDKYFNGQWYLPGGKSYVAQLFQDAGADYLWKNNPNRASFPLDFEAVFAKARQADYWRIIGTYGSKASYRGLASENELYTHFKAFKQHHILFCDPQSTQYFEKSPLEPQIVLADFIKAFHPDLLPGYQPRYYKILP